jgi:hypothetical protein
MTTDVALAEREAEQARHAAETAETDLASGKRSVGFDALHRLRDKMRHADAAAAGARAKAERDREAARLGALEELGKRIDAAAASAGKEIAAALADTAEAVRRVREAVTAHDEEVAEFATAATDLGATRPAPGGPRPADAGVAVAHDGRVWHGRTLLRPISARLDEALGHALRDDAVSAIAAVQGCETAPEPRRAAHYFRSARGGAIHAFEDPLPPVHAAQVRSGDLVPLTESEIVAFLAGELR